MRLVYAMGATWAAGFTGFFAGTMLPLHPLNRDLRVAALVLCGATLCISVLFIGVGVAGGY